MHQQSLAGAIMTALGLVFDDLSDPPRPAEETG
jgi:hypothetical protein